MRTVFLTALLFLAVFAAHASEAAAPTERSWKIDGVERKAMLYIPAKASTETSPLLMLPDEVFGLIVKFFKEPTAVTTPASVPK